MSSWDVMGDFRVLAITIENCHLALKRCGRTETELLIVSALTIFCVDLTLKRLQASDPWETYTLKRTTSSAVQMNCGHFLDAVRSNRAEFIAVYVRRRVGKTFLVRKAFGERFTFQHAGLSEGGKTTSWKRSPTPCTAASACRG